MSHNTLINSQDKLNKKSMLCFDIICLYKFVKRCVDKQNFYKVQNNVTLLGLPPYYVNKGGMQIDKNVTTRT